MGKITFTSMDKAINTASFRINSEWDLTGTSVSVDNSQTPTVKYTMIFKRRPLFLLTTLILPTVFMALLNIFVFCLPQPSGERIGFVVCSSLYDYCSELTSCYSYAPTVSHLYHSHD